MKWIAHQNVNVDRVVCPWLIRKFADLAAELLFVPADQVLALAPREGTILFDVTGVELGHHGQECSFYDTLYACCQEIVRQGKPAGEFKAA